MEGYHHHHHNVSASRTQELPLITTSHSLHSSSSSGMTNSHIGRLPSSIGEVPMTTTGPITISVVVALTLVICMILNCGKVKRKLSPYRSNRHTRSLFAGEKSINPVKPATALSSSVSPLPPSGSGASPWSTTSTLFHPKFPPPVAQQSHGGPFYQPHYHHPLPPPQNTLNPLSPLL